MLTNLLIAIVTCGFAASVIVQAGTHERGTQASTDPEWSELITSMDKIQPTGDSDVDFVRLMLPHHQAALDMAKTQLVYGQDAQMRRLAQEIITDQQLEIELMQRWLKQREAAGTESQVEVNPATTAETRKGN